jgi:1-acyl-sn-glycerol-3-phosphate acyltransferase
VVCRPKVAGVDALACLERPVVLVANHASHLDCPVLLHALPRRVRRRTAVVAAADYFYRTRMRGLAVTVALGAMPFDRERHTAAALEGCRRVLTAGGSLLMFPEGTRSRDGAIAPFKIGAARLAITSGAAVVPIGLSGLHAVLPAGSHIPHPHRIGVSIGAPMWPRPDEDARAFTARIEAQVRRLCGEPCDEPHLLSSADGER